MRHRTDNRQLAVPMTVADAGNIAELLRFVADVLIAVPCSPTDYVTINGYRRGATNARRLANELDEQIQRVEGLEQLERDRRKKADGAARRAAKKAAVS